MVLKAANINDQLNPTAGITAPFNIAAKVPNSIRKVS
jgi:hypothetical protein